jgi:transposase
MARAPPGKGSMSYRELTMIEIREVLRRWQAGQAIREIARESCVDRKTVRRYLQAAEQCAVPSDAAISDEHVRAVAERIQSRSEATPSAERERLRLHRERIESWLSSEPPLRLSKVHRLLERDGVSVSYATLRRFVARELGLRKRLPTVRVDDAAPGQEAQVDFGRMGRMYDPATGRTRTLWALVVTLCHSRYAFVWPTFEQTSVATCEGLEAAFRFFGAVPRVIVPDNMKSIVQAADALAPTINASFLEYAQSRHFFIDPARVRRPQDKPRVENMVAYVREDWFAGESFDSLSAARESAASWCKDVAGARVHGTTRQVPRDVFDLVERGAMLPLPAAPFDVPTWHDAKVHDDHHIQVRYSLYSVPTRYVGSKVRARVDKTTVRIYLGSEFIKAHPRVPPGKRSTDPSDYPVGKAPYATRRIDELVDSADRFGPHVRTYAERLMAGPLPWSRMRQVYGLLRLCKKYGAARVDDACGRALAFDVLDVPRVERMLKAAYRAQEKGQHGGQVVVLHPPRFARHRAHFETIKATKSDDRDGES